MDIRLCLYGALMASVVFLPNYSFSQDAAAGEVFEVSTPETVQNGGVGNILDGGDKLFVTNEGSIDITPNGDENAQVIQVSDGANEVENAGHLRISKLVGDGVFVLVNVSTTSTNTMIENSGLMELISGPDAGNHVGVNSVGATGDVTVINYATGEINLSMQGDNVASGIEYKGLGDLTFTNAGTLSVKAKDTHRVRALTFAGRNLDVDISGTVTTELETGNSNKAALFATLSSGINDAAMPSHRKIDISGSVLVHGIDKGGVYTVWNDAPNLTVNISGSVTGTSEVGTANTGIRSNAPGFVLNIASSGKLSSQAGTGATAQVKALEVGGNAAQVNSAGIITASSMAAAGAVYGVKINSNDLRMINSGSVDASTTGNGKVYGIKSTGARAVVNNSGSIGAVTTGNGHIYSVIGTGADTSVVNSGIITASSMAGNMAVHGITSLGARAVVNNSGSVDVVTTGDGAVYGVVVTGADGFVVNSGIITASSMAGNGGVYGIRAAGARIRITNSGSISTSALADGLVYGIRSTGARTRITNSGSINAVTTGTSGVYGIRVVGEDATVVNSGSISTSALADGLVYGIRSTGARTRITNSGSINAVTTGTSGVYGVSLFDGGSLVNSGTITSSGTGQHVPLASYAVGGSGAITISNSGSIIGSVKNNIAAINLVGGGGSLEFGKGSFIVGEVLLGGDTSISIDGNLANSLHYVFGGDGRIIGGKPQVFGSSPVFYSAAYRAKEIAILDTGYLIAGIDALEVMTGNVSGLIRSRRFVQDDSKSHVWVSGALSRRTSGENVNFFTADDEIKDFAVGVDGGSLASVSVGDSLPSLSVGGLVGANTSSLGKSGGNDMPDSYQRESIGMFGAVYAIRHFDRIFVQSALSVGFLKHNDERFIQDNTVDSGIDMARSSYHSYWYSPEVTLGVGISAFDWTYTPSVNLRYARQWVDAYRETGSKSNVNYDRHAISLISGRAGLAVDRQFSSTHLTLRAGFQSFGLIGSNDVSFSMLDGPEQTFVMQSGNNKGVYGGVDGALQLSQNASVTLGGEAIISKEKKIHTRLTAGLDVAF